MPALAEDDPQHPVHAPRPLVPPLSTDVHDSGPDPEGTRGRRQLFALALAGMQPDHDVLEIGCGGGRLAYELDGYLDDTGSYHGLDVGRAAIDWLRDNYERHRSNFRFDHLDLHNAWYHGDGGGDAALASFPQPDASIDTIGSFAVFMHLLPDEIGRYLREIRRVLRPDGRALITVPVIVDPAGPPLRLGSDEPFLPIGDGVYTRGGRRGVQSKAFDRDRIVELVHDAGLHIGSFVPYAFGAAGAGADTTHDIAGGDAFVLQVESPGTGRSSDSRG